MAPVPARSQSQICRKIAKRFLPPLRFFAPGRIFAILRRFHFRVRPNQREKRLRYLLGHATVGFAKVENGSIKQKVHLGDCMKYSRWSQPRHHLISPAKVESATQLIKSPHHMCETAGGNRIRSQRHRQQQQPATEARLFTKCVQLTDVNWI